MTSGDDVVRALILAGFGVMGLLSLVLGLAIYFIPTIVAVRERHRNRVGIGILNTFLGWSIVGWVVALVWAVYKERQP